MENKRKISVVELVKDGLILLLTCSALWLLAQTPLADPLPSADYLMKQMDSRLA